MKNQLLVDVDSERKPEVTIGKLKDSPRPSTMEEFTKTVLLDMACLCEAVVTLIHLADQQGMKPKEDSLRHCVEHLRGGCADENYKPVCCAPKPAK